MLRICKNIVTFVIGLIAVGAAIADDYTPSSSLSILEPWRWRELEPLHGLSLSCGAESDDGRLWFGGKGALLTYDGYVVSETKLPVGFENANVFQIVASEKSSVYVYTSEGLFYFSENRWTLLADFDVQFPLRVREFMVRNEQGVLFACTPNSIVQLKKGELEKVLELDEPSNSFSIDVLNRIWVVEATRSQLASYQTGESGLVLPFDKTVHPMDEIEKITDIQIIGSKVSDEVWTVSRNISELPKVFSPLANVWKEHDLSYLTGSNAHATGKFLDHDTLFVESKTSLLLRQDQQWIRLEVPGITLPISSVFTFLRSNGNLIIGGQGEPTYEVELSDDQWESYDRLNFQCESSNKRQWFLSFEGGVVEYNVVHDRWHTHVEGVIDTPVGMLRSNDDTLWVYGSHSGVPAVSYSKGDSWQLRLHPEQDSYIGYMSAVELRDGRILFGSGPTNGSSERGGLLVYKKSGDEYFSRHIPRSLAPARPVSLAEDREGGIWIAGTSLVTMDSRLESSYSGEQPPNPEEWIDHVVSDHNGEIWAAIWTEGLFRKELNAWTRIQVPEQIASDHVAYILPDQFRIGQLWAATNRGISRFDGDNWIPDSLPESISFRREGGTLRQSMNGDIWVNKAPRSWYFRTRENKAITEGIASTFKTVRFRPDRTPPVVEIESYDDNITRPSSINIRWSGLDKWSDTPKAGLRYSYRMGESDWSAFSSQLHTSFADVPSGEHRFQVKVIDRDGNISAMPAEVLITVLPPYWQRPGFIVSAIGAMLIIAFLLFLLIRQGIRHVLKIEEFKIQFFTNISHELRTPLTVILAPLERLLKKETTGEEKSDLELAHKNARKMQVLIDQLLDFRSAEQGPVRLHWSRYDFVHCLGESVRLIEPLAKEKSQEIRLSSSVDSFEGWFDPEKIETIFSNLLSNAIKYTHGNGYIEVNVRFSESEGVVCANVIIEDNGPGIPKSDIDHIWETFYRGDNSKNKAKGSGIGLAYARVLVEAHGGSIGVESPVVNVEGNMQGTRFTVSLPLTDPSRDESEVESPGQSRASVVDAKRGDDATTILVIEDDSDIRGFISNELGKIYDVREAKDGSEGWQLAQEIIPDIILCDVMMPRKNGRELCRLVKDSVETNHIPVILLTALKSEANEMAGLESGADDYISKPVNLTILKQRIHNMISSRKLIHNRYKTLSPEAKLQAQDLTDNSQDEAFVANALNIVESNCDNNSLDVELLAAEIGMSRMTLYRKLKAITGETPGYFIRTVRMKKAAEYLQKESHNISEIADLVGFSDISQFSKSFKKFFQKSPSQYREQYRK